MNIALRTDPPGEALVEHWETLPPWWRERGNEFWAPEGATCPEIQEHPGLPLPSEARIIIRCANSGLSRFILWDEGAHVEIGDDVVMGSGTMSCQGGAKVVIGNGLRTGPLASFDARNGGSITVGPDGLWSTNVQVITDDMHAIRDMHTGERLNKRGSHVVIGRHVWIGQEVMVLADSSIGDNSIVGARSIVSGTLPSNVAAAGAPARVLRAGVTWSAEDAP